MFKIEKTLLISQNVDNLAFINVIKQFLKETNMLISNIHLTHVQLKKDIGDSFPLETNLYDGSWYKNLLIAAEIIIDRLHSRIDPNKDYLKMFDDIHDCDFVEFAKKWNKINFMVKYNLQESEWLNMCKQFNVQSTSRKLEEIIARKVVINLPLLRSISLNIEKYRSVAKTLDNQGTADYDNLLSLLVPKQTEQTPSSNMASQDQSSLDSTKPQTMPSTSLLVNKEAKGPLSPIKKEMDQILKWIKLREEEIKLFKNKMNKTVDPQELKAIDRQLDAVWKELEANENLLKAAKNLVPVDPLAKDMAQIARWAKEQEDAIKRFHKSRNGDTANKEELKELEKFLAMIQKDLVFVNDELAKAKNLLPTDPMVREMSTILSWIKSRQPDIRAYKRKLVGESINDELKLIERELSLLDGRETEVETTIKYINSNRPIDPYKKELDELLRWITAKEKEIRKERKLVANELNVVDKELNKKMYGLLDDVEPFHERLKREIKYTDNQIKDAENELKPPRSQDTSKRKVLLAPPSNVEPKNKNELAPVVQSSAPIVKYDKEKLYDIAKIYDVEAEVLMAAIEILPKELAARGRKEIPKMLQHLLDNGYIEVNENYVSDPKNKYKLKQVSKVSV